MSNMKEKKETRQYRQYDTEFKKNAVKLLADGRSVSSVSKSLGVPEKNLYAWRKQYNNSDSESDSLLLELKEVRKLLKSVEEERDILKKALSIFSRQI